MFPLHLPGGLKSLQDWGEKMHDEYYEVEVIQDSDQIDYRILYNQDEVDEYIKKISKDSNFKYYLEIYSTHHSHSPLPDGVDCQCLVPLEVLEPIYSDYKWLLGENHE